MKKLNLVLFIAFISSMLLFSCKDKTSKLNIFVRDGSGTLLSNGLKAKIVLTNDPNAPTSTAKFFDTTRTSGPSVSYNLDNFFKSQKASYGDTVREGYIKINATLNELSGDTIVRVTYGTTSVQTIYIK